MPRNRFVSASIVLLIVAWLIAIPSVYLVFDTWVLGDGTIMRHIPLRPYALYIGTCPFLLFWVACIFAAIVGVPGPKMKANAVPPPEPSVLSKIALVLSVIGNCIGAAIGLPVLFSLFLLSVTGHMYIQDTIVFALLEIVVFFALAYTYRRVETVNKDSPFK